MIEEYKDVIALYIKPYRITITDILKAENGEKANRKKACFHDNEDGFVDYDIDSANFHKKIPDKGTIKDIEPQVVLVQDKVSPIGPGWREKCIVEECGEYYLKSKVKTDWYFPHIDDEKHSESLTDLIKN